MEERGREKGKVDKLLEYIFKLGIMLNLKKQIKARFLKIGFDQKNFCGQ